MPGATCSSARDLARPHTLPQPLNPGTFPPMRMHRAVLRIATRNVAQLAVLAVLLAILAGCSSHVTAAGVQKPGIAADPSTYLADVRRDLQARWPKHERIDIVIHGHSVPAGFAATPVVDSLHAYPSLLRNELAVLYPHAVFNVVVTARGGENSIAGAERFERDVMALRPRVILIDYALNDRRVGMDASRQAWSRMIEQAVEGGAKVILVTPTPDQSETTDALKRHAQQVRDLAREYGVGLADATAAFDKHIADGARLEDLMAQVNHPNLRGHQLVARELRKWFVP